MVRCGGLHLHRKNFDNYIFAIEVIALQWTQCRVYISENLKLILDLPNVSLFYFINT